VNINQGLTELYW